jgi:hypothetical protein
MTLNLDPAVGATASTSHSAAASFPRKRDLPFFAGMDSRLRACEKIGEEALAGRIQR